MITLPSVPLFLGPVELLLVGAVVLVILFGSRATDIARDAGSAAGKVTKTRHAAEEEIEDVRAELKEPVEPVKEELEEVEQEVEAVEKDIEAVDGTHAGDTDGPGSGGDSA